MNLLTTTKDLLKQYKIKPDKFKSQNFLINNEVYNDIVAAADINLNDTVLEIGPGLGFLTTRLLQKAKKVIAVEVDDDLFKVLQQAVGGYKNFELIKKNVLGFDETKIFSGYKLVSNLPYHLTGKILKKFLTSQNKPQSMTVLVQKEVAERICSNVGQHSLLSLSVQYYGQPQIVRLVSKKDFMPVPKVDSALLKITNINPVTDIALAKKFWQVVKIGFSSKRKTLAHNLSASLKVDKKSVKDKIEEVGLKDKVRAQELSIDDWERLVETL